jgi:hypothetical protein
MARGIWKNSLLKILLTRGFLGEIFRPLLYSSEEYLHYSFLAAMNAVTQQILALQDFKSRGLAYFWLIDVPRTIFEQLFFTDEDEQTAAGHSDFFKATDGSETAYLTQGYVWFYLEYLLNTNDSAIAPYSKDLRKVAALLSSLFVPESKIAYYHSYFTLLSASAQDTMLEETAQLYITQAINYLAITNGAVSVSATPAFIQTSSRKCAWKLENAKYTTVTMLKCWQ